MCSDLCAGVPHLVTPPCSSEIALAWSFPAALLSGEFLGKPPACLEGTATAEPLDPKEDSRFHREQ